ncbi:TVP38/TMEM64 family protein [Rhodococcus sp. G-MC3]|uniref:TVP38/TMEM64 family protein n=1 Tax=Rhodococcus sp. G-MC3 TaxID=3046209 RepID=UPI0024B88D1F|nr:TVP38/TMEM64 family protein [Rhodococcus sp. G-MC3]MDJ0394940.1 TVP38/TMEM64 family protein [Rhodococcus sp. G-MC3]
MKRCFRDPRLIGLVALLVALAIAAAVAPHPSVDQLREWAHSVGPAFPFVFFAVHALVTVAPVPRTLFTLAAGLLFGPVMGILVTVAASTLSAVLALLLVRIVGRDWFATRMTHSAVRTIDDSLARRGWLAVGSLRLIAPVPFSVVNYCCGVSSIGIAPFALATAIGVVPGTVGIVVLGDALGGNADPLLLALSGSCIALGVVGLVVDWKLSTSRHHANGQAVKLD